MPRRIQMSRQHPWREDNPTAIRVDRATKFGNPFKGEQGAATMTREILSAEFRAWLFWEQSRTHSGRQDEPRPWTLTPDQSDAKRAAILDALPKLRGRDLACWCPTYAPCHADVLLEIANA